MQDILLPFPEVIIRAVAWGDMDAFQHVNNTVYFRYFESVRIAYFDKIGMMENMEATGIGPILKSSQCKYRIPLTYPDTISLGARVTDVGEDRFTMKHVVVSHRHQKIAAEGEGVLVTFDYREGKKAPIPDIIRQKIEALEQ